MCIQRQGRRQEEGEVGRWRGEAAASAAAVEAAAVLQAAAARLAAWAVSLGTPPPS